MRPFSPRVLIPASWGFVSFMLRLCARFTTKRGFVSGKTRPFVVTGATRQPYARGPDLTEGVVAWAQRTLGESSPTVITELRQLDKLEVNRSFDILIVTNDWLMEVLSRPFWQQVRSSFYLLRKRTPIWVMLPDMYIPQQTLLSASLVSFSGGLHPMIVNSPQSAMRFGLPNPTGPHFWTLPSFGGEIEEPLGWNQKEQLAIGSKSGETKRVEMIECLIPELERNGYRLTWSHSSELPYSVYLDALRQSKIAIVPTMLQAEYQSGPRGYRKKLSETILTGRVWESFASGCALLTNKNQDLEDLGFEPMVHYVPIPFLFDSELSWQLPSDATLSRIAEMGRKRFIDLLWKETAPSLPRPFPRN